MVARGPSVVLRLGSRELIAADLQGNSEVILRAPSFPCCVDWLPDDVYSWSRHGMAFCTVGSRMAGC
jgi:hypothetical protein